MALSYGDFVFLRYGEQQFRACSGSLHQSEQLFE
jgi:hypothetical protein